MPDRRARIGAGTNQFSDYPSLVCSDGATAFLFHVMLLEIALNPARLTVKTNDKRATSCDDFEADGTVYFFKSWLMLVGISFVKS
ncbi:hypothetical protein EVAR_24888_1 [Eumeta japonica]|uniref:Uncharacterized protein n=1 Tax=Eumeta variegata TaxID=151549 RepID=A0A4C1V7I9_EUMVA|nr:hypothetical protein EVAR_24888_1 [Eumeta japonica]